MLMRFTKRGGFTPPLRAALTAALLALPAAACEGLLDVTDTDTTRDQFLENTAAIPALRAAVITDFTAAYELLLVYGGMLGDEYRFSETFPTRLEVDARDIDTNNGTMLGVFSSATTAGATADFVSARYDVADPNSERFFQRAEARTLGGYALLALAENYCSGVPISRLTRSSGGDLEFRYGTAITTTEMVDSAIARFNQALAIVAAGNAIPAANRLAEQSNAALLNQERLARVGLARALLYRGNGDAAAAAAVVASVPTTYTYQLQHSANSGGENSFPWFFNISNERVTVASQEGDATVGGNVGLPYRATRAGQPGGRDPRVLWLRRNNNNVGFDNSTPLFDALKYPTRTAFTVLASGVEARLIEAEAAFRAGNGAGMLAILNALRADVQPLMQLLNADYVIQQAAVGYAPGQGAVLAPLVLPATAAGQRALLFEERAYWLWVTGHRLADMRRLVRQYGMAEDAVFPNGVHPKGVAYGDDINLPIPVQEENNPIGAGQCLNRDA